MPTPSSACVGGRTRSRLTPDAPPSAARMLRKKLASRPRKRRRSPDPDPDPASDDVADNLPDPAPDASETPDPPPEPSPLALGRSVAERTRNRRRGNAVAPAPPPRAPVLICLDDSGEEDPPSPRPVAALLVPKEEAPSTPTAPADSVSAVGRNVENSGASAASAEREHAQANAGEPPGDASGGQRRAVEHLVEVKVEVKVEGDLELSGPPIASELGSNRASSGTAVGGDAAAPSSAPTFEDEDGDEDEEELPAEGDMRRAPETNCIARRTRSKLWFGKELEPVDYSVFFKPPETSDEEDYVPCAAASSGSWTSEDTFGDGSSFWSESESDMEMDMEANGWITQTAEEGSIGTPFGMWGRNSSGSNSERERGKIGVSGPSKNKSSRKWRNESNGVRKRKKHRFSDYDDEDDGDYNCEEEECGSSGPARRPRENGGGNGDTGKARRKVIDRRKRQRRNQKIGTAARPHRVDADEESDRALSPSSSSSSGVQSDGLRERNVIKKRKRYDDDILNEGEVGEGIHVKPSTKRKKNMGKSEFTYNVILDDILKKGDMDVEAGKGNEELLPLLFSFGDDDPEPAEKTELEKAMDELWDEYNFALRSIDIGCYNVPKEEPQASKVLESEVHSSLPCIQDHHDFFLDEEVGIMCKHCGLVVLERRYVFAKFGATPGIYGKALTEEKENILILDALCSKGKFSDFSYIPGMHGGTAWDLIPNVKDTMYPHQQEGFEFMWKNLAGDILLDNLKNPNTDSIGGCVISHAPGTGKSRLAIVFLQSFMAAFPHCRPVILAPRGMLLMWDKEFKKWKVNIPFHLLNGEEYSGKEDASALNLARDKPKNMRWMRIVKLLSWNNGNGVLGLSYGLFEKLVGKKFKRHAEAEQISNILIERPGLFIFDEGHTPRNERSSLWKVLEKVKTERRIILSGTPFQNNFGELYNTLCLVRPKFVEKLSRSKHRQKYANFSTYKDIFNMEKDAGKGKWTQLTSSITDESLKELKMVMSPFVHVHNGSILKKLPGLRECLVILKPLPIQKKMISKIESMRPDATFAREYEISLALIHPSLYPSEMQEESILNRKHLDGLRLNPDEGVKTRFVVELVRLSLALREKVLVFSQFIGPLSLMKEQLTSLFNWTEGKEILQMDGSIRLKHRQASIDIFNNPASDVRVLLASTRACCEGISLTGASRVVLLDVVWNPSVENQAISRAFRLGQEKVVYTYNLIASGTREIEKYSRQVQKERISERVFSSRNEHCNLDTARGIFEDRILEEMKGHEKLKSMFTQIICQPKNYNLMDTFDLRWRE